jgi:hypothetical protein
MTHDTINPIPRRKQQLIGKVAPKWGDEAAGYAWKQRQLRLYAGPPLIIALIPFLGLRSIWPYCIGAFAILETPVVVLSFVYGHRMNVAASKCLGIKITWKAESCPPDSSPAYEEWCAKNGLTPYAASERVSHDDGDFIMLPGTTRHSVSTMLVVLGGTFLVIGVGLTIVISINNYQVTFNWLMIIGVLIALGCVLLLAALSEHRQGK